MPIDPSIILRSMEAPRRVKYPSEIEEEQLALADLRDQRKMRAMQLKEAERQHAVQEQLREIFRQTPDIEKALPQVLAADPTTGISLQGKLAEQRKNQLDFEIKKLELQGKQVGEFASIAGTINDEASFANGVRMAAARGLLKPDGAQQILAMGWTPETQALLRQYQTAALSAKEQLDQQWKKLQEERAATEFGWKQEDRPLEQRKLTADATSAEAEAQTKQITAGQFKEYGMSKEAFERAAAQALRDKAREKFQQQQLAQRNLHHAQDLGIRRELNQITRENKPPTGGERLVLGYYLRAKQATENIEALESHIAGMGTMDQAWYKYAPNAAQSANNQKLAQAQRAFTEARLRRESGAAIPESEFENDRVTYFPQPGDTPEVLRQKKEARNEVLRSLRIGAGNAMKDIGERPGDMPRAPQSYRMTAVGPDGHKIGSNDGQTWFDVETGKQVQ